MFGFAMHRVFEVQDEVAQKIVVTLVGKIERTDLERSLQKEANLSAYEYVLRGRHYFGDWKAGEEDIRRSREMFEQAIKLDSRYAAAYSGLASAIHQQCKYGWTDDPEAAADQCIELARKAIELHADNILYETDFPHPTSMSPGPQSAADHPRDYAERVLGDLPEAAVAKVLHDNAARLYGLD